MAINLVGAKMKVYWCVPTYGIGVSPDIYHNHTAAIMTACCKYGIRFGGSCVTKNQLVWAARNNLVDSVFGDKDVNIDEDYLFWVDSDVMLKNDTLPMLLSHKKDVISGIYYQKQPPYWPLIMVKLPWETRAGMHNFLYDYPKGLHRVDAIGFGCVLTKISVFKKLAKPWFDWKVESGEDIFFCVEAKKAGIEIHADSNATVVHLGDNVEISEETFANYKKNHMDKASIDTFLVEENKNGDRNL